MVVIRLTRTGSKKSPFYHVVVADKRSPRDGARIEQVGFYNPSPRGKDEAVRLELDRIDHWLSTGAQMSDTVKALVKSYRKAVATPSEETQAA